MGIAALILFSLTACGRMAAAEPATSAPARWEYRITAPIDRDFVAEMNQAGAEGWEIVALRRVDTTDADVPAFKRGFQPAPGATQDQFEVAIRIGMDKMKYEAVMKRPKR